MNKSGFELITIKEVKIEYPFLIEREGFDYFEEWEDQDFFLVARQEVNYDGNFYLDLYEDKEKKWLSNLLNLPLKELKAF
jgi:hypothetical protein